MNSEQKYDIHIEMTHPAPPLDIAPGTLRIQEESRPIVSVIMPTYNRRSYLERSIRSLQRQDFTNWELIVVDDGSTDGSITVLTEIADANSKIRIMRHTNRGFPFSLNAGIGASTGRYITFLDSDDEYLEGHLRLRVDLLDQEPQLSIVHGAAEVIGDPYLIDFNDPTKKIHSDECRLGATYFGRRHVFVELGGFRTPTLFCDTDFMMRAESRYVTRRVPFRTYRYYRDTPNSIVTTALHEKHS